MNKMFDKLRKSFEELCGRFETEDTILESEAETFVKYRMSVKANLRGLNETTWMVREQPTQGAGFRVEETVWLRRGVWQGGPGYPYEVLSVTNRTDAGVFHSNYDVHRLIDAAKIKRPDQKFQLIEITTNTKETEI